MRLYKLRNGYCSVVAIRGPQKGTEAEWMYGAEYMDEKIKPSIVLHFGRKEGSYIWKDRAIYLPLNRRRKKTVENLFITE